MSLSKGGEAETWGVCTSPKTHRAAEKANGTPCPFPPPGIDGPLRQKAPNTTPRDKGTDRVGTVTQKVTRRDQRN